MSKIGVSSNPEKRLKRITKNNTDNVKIIKEYDNSGYLETILHKKYEQYRTVHTLYDDGKTEWFSLTENQLKEIDEFISQI